MKIILFVLVLAMPPIKCENLNETATAASTSSSTDDWSTIEIDIPEDLIIEYSEESSNMTADPTNQTVMVSRWPCRCKAGICSCCTGLLFSALENRMCVKLKYVREDFGFDFAIEVNQREIYYAQTSGRYPPPICFTLPVVPIGMCVTFHNVYFTGPNMHICMDVMARFYRFDLFDRPLGCVQFGTNGIMLEGPNGDGGLAADVDSAGGLESYDEIS